MNKKIILLSLIFVNAAMHATPWSTNWIAGMAAVVTGTYNLVTKTRVTEQKPVVQDERQKFLNMLTNAVNSDIRRLNLALQYKSGFDSKFDVMHVWEKATEKASEKFPDLQPSVNYAKWFERPLQTEQEIKKAREVLENLRDKIIEEKKKQ